MYTYNYIWIYIYVYIYIYVQNIFYIHEMKMIIQHIEIVGQSRWSAEIAQSSRHALRPWYHASREKLGSKLIFLYNSNRGV
jgi:hypothetical protein